MAASVLALIRILKPFRPLLTAFTQRGSMVLLEKKHFSIRLMADGGLSPSPEQPTGCMEEFMKILMLLTAAVMAFTLCACGKTETVIIPPKNSPTVESSAPAESEKPEAPAESPIPEYVVNIYYGDENAENILYEGLVINELSPQTLLDELYRKGVFSAPVTAGSFTVDNYNVIHLDLDSAFGSQISAMGTSGEQMMMGSLVNTFLDAFDADGLSLTVEGKILETGHVIYDFTLEFFE